MNAELWNKLARGLGAERLADLAQTLDALYRDRVGPNSQLLAPCTPRPESKR